MKIIERKNPELSKTITLADSGSDALNSSETKIDNFLKYCSKLSEVDWVTNEPCEKGRLNLDLGETIEKNQGAIHGF